MLKIGYDKNEELEFKLDKKHKGYSACITYKKAEKENRKGVEVALWLLDKDCGYKKFIGDKFIENSIKIVKQNIKEAVNKMFDDEAFDKYIKTFEKEINCISEMYAREEEKIRGDEN